MYIKLLLPLVLIAVLTGCSIRRLQPPQYGTQVVQQVKVLGTRIVVPSSSTTGGSSLLEIFLGYVTETVIIIPVVSNVSTNGNVSAEKPIVASAPLSTAFGISESGSTAGVKLSDSIISGYEGTVGFTTLISPQAVVTNRIK